jgi:hypothetical protein
MTSALLAELMAALEECIELTEQTGRSVQAESLRQLRDRLREEEGE